MPGEAVPWARAGGGKTTARFTPAKQRNYMAALRTICAAAMRGPPIDDSVGLEVHAVYQWPASWSTRKRAKNRWKVSRPDLDNCALKLVEDSLQTVAWTDDARVCLAILLKYYDDTPQLRVSIVRLNPCPNLPMPMMLP